MSSRYETICKLVGDYNTAMAARDIPRAVQMGKLAVANASEELANPDDLPINQKTYYESVLSSIQPFLDNPSAAEEKKAKSSSSGSGNASEDKIKSTDWFGAPIPNLSLKDIAGLGDLKEQFFLNVFAPMHPDYAKIYSKYKGNELGLQVLLYGPPGTGKTHAVKCLAGEMKCKIAVVQIKDVMANLVGDGAKIIAEIFEQASKLDRCIIFFDEIDAIACSREGDDSRHTKEQLTTLLTYMDGFTSKTKPGQVRIVIAATNRPWALDSAVKRGGRFDTQILVPLPDVEARMQLVRLALGKDPKVKNRVDIPCASDVTTEWLAERFEGFAGADIKSVCRQAAGAPLKREILSFRKGRHVSDCITRDDFNEVLARYINSITDGDLRMYDAYSLNLSVGIEYLKTKAEQLVLKLYNDDYIEGFERRMLIELYDSGKITEWVGPKYKIDFVPEKVEALRKK